MWQPAPAPAPPHLVEYMPMSIEVAKNQFMLAHCHWKETMVVGAYYLDLELCVGTKMLQQRTAMVKTANWKNRMCSTRVSRYPPIPLFSSLCNAQHPGLVGVADEELTQMVFYRHEIHLCIYSYINSYLRFLLTLERRTPWFLKSYCTLMQLVQRLQPCGRNCNRAM